MTLAEKKANLKDILQKEEIHFRHLRTQKSGNITIAYTVEGDQVQDAAYIFCSPNDGFCLTEGRFRAANRLITGRKTYVRKDLHFSAKDSELDIKFLQHAAFVKAPRWFTSFIPTYIKESSEARRLRAMKKLSK